MRGSAGCSHAAALPAAADAPAPGRARQATLAALGGFAERERWCARLCSVRLLPGSGAGLTPGAGQGGCRRPAVARGRTGEAALQLNQRPGHCAAPRRQHAARRKAGQARRRRRGRRRGRAPPAAARHGARAGRSLGVHPAARRRTGRAVRPRPWPPALPIVPSWCLPGGAAPWLRVRRPCARPHRACRGAKAGAAAEEARAAARRRPCGYVNRYTGLECAACGAPRWSGPGGQLRARLAAVLQTADAGTTSTRQARPGRPAPVAAARVLWRRSATQGGRGQACRGGPCCPGCRGWSGGAAQVLRRLEADGGGQVPPVALSARGVRAELDAVLLARGAQRALCEQVRRGTPHTAAALRTCCAARSRSAPGPFLPCPGRSSAPGCLRLP